MIYYEFNGELTHHGVLGQKWGIRRYQNYDGTYTQAGMKRYNKSLDTYNKRKEAYSQIKGDSSKSRYEKKYAKAQVKEAKRQLNKDYKHLAQDKKADQGKILYKNGYRIRKASELNTLAMDMGATIAAGSLIANRLGYLDANTAMIGEYVGAGMTATALAINALNEIPNSKLRAYYSHTSNY